MKKKRSGDKSSRRARATRVAPRVPSTSVGRSARLFDWLSAARPATLGLAVAPVILGWGVAVLHLLLAGIDAWTWVAFYTTILALALAVLLQIGVNFANDYSDGIRGTDANRGGPARLTASGAVPARRVRMVALVFFFLAALVGLALTVLTEHWWLLGVGALAIAAAWFYTGGKRPYGYMGLGEIVVFVFFGLVATAGTTFLLTDALPIEAIVAGVAMGCFASAVLHVNNVRDRETDIASGKRTLATRLPLTVNRVLFTLLVLAPFALLVVFVMALDTTGFAYFALCFALPAIVITWTATTPREYVLALKLTVWSSLAYAVIVAWAIAF